MRVFASSDTSGAAASTTSSSSSATSNSDGNVVILTSSNSSPSPSDEQSPDTKDEPNDDDKNNNNSVAKNPFLRQQLQSESIDSLAARIIVNRAKTPLLKASLSSPPVAHAATDTPPTPPLLPTTACPASITNSTSSPSSAKSNENVCVDLTLQSRKRGGNSTTATISRGCRQNASTTEMYSNLLEQLSRKSTAESASSVTFSLLPSTTASAAGAAATPTLPKLTAAARKEKLRAQTSFQCPVCKKRFQRHIAMNAHFQNEHIGQVQNEKICRLCSFRAGGISSIRLHLLHEHNIDLDTPTACLADPEPENSTPSSSSQGSVTVQLIKAAPRFSPSTASAAKGGQQLCKEGPPMEQAKDLSIRSTSTKRNSSQDSVGEPKRQRADYEEDEEDINGGSNNFRCINCSIVFPNQTLYFLHRGFHSETNPWRCNGCGQVCVDMYDFNTHLVSDAHG